LSEKEEKKTNKKKKKNIPPPKQTTLYIYKHTHQHTQTNQREERTKKECERVPTENFAAPLRFALRALAAAAELTLDIF